MSCETLQFLETSNSLPKRQNLGCFGTSCEGRSWCPHRIDVLSHLRPFRVESRASRGYLRSRRFICFSWNNNSSVPPRTATHHRKPSYCNRLRRISRSSTLVKSFTVPAERWRSETDGRTPASSPDRQETYPQLQSSAGCPAEAAPSATWISVGIGRTFAPLGRIFAQFADWLFHPSR